MPLGASANGQQAIRSGDRGFDWPHHAYEADCECANFCNQSVFIAKAAGGAWPIGSPFAIVRVQCKLRRIEANAWEASNGKGFFSGTAGRGVERCAREQAAWSEWTTADGHAVATILHDLLKALNRVAYQRLNEGAVRTSFPFRQLPLLFQLYQEARHVELAGVSGEQLRAQQGAPTLLQLLLVEPMR